MRRLWESGGRSVCLFALAYFIADTALNRFAFSDGWTIIWPLNGVTVALLLKRRQSTWPWMLLGVELGTGLGECLDHNPVLLEIGQRICSATEVTICALLLPPFARLEDWLRTPRVYGRFFLALMLGPGISGVMAALMFQHAAGQPFLLAFNNWATADVLGIATTMPLMLSFNSDQMRRLFVLPALPRTLGLQLLCLGGSALIFSCSRYSLTFLLFPLLLLVESFLAFAGSAIAIVGVCLVAVYCTTQGLGPFGAWPADSPLPRDFALQIYFGFHLLALFPVSIVLMERQRLSAELRRTNARLTLLASLDGLTGIGNRRLFDERFAEAWIRAARLRRPLAVAILDIDNFKQFNDLYGHVQGDACLRSVAEVLQVEMRGPDDLVARFGGEEFAIMMPGASAEAARLAAERVRNAILNLGIVHLGNTWNRVSVSIGYASVVPTSADGRLGLIQLADAALYRAKREGRNCVETITSIEGLRAANDHYGDTTQIRLMRLLKGRER